MTVGRVGVTSGALPIILPVVFGVSGTGVVFRVLAGTALAVAAVGQVVVFEADDVDHGQGHGWSVIVHGVAHEATDPTDLHQARTLPLATTVVGEHGRVIRVPAEIISGRGITFHAPPF